MAADPNKISSNANSTNIFEQIEATADYYPPSTYAQLLTYFDDFTVGSDPASGQFWPLTQVSTTWGEQSILFAVGIIPPAASVTGRLLDRTASIAAVDGAPEQVGNQAVAAAATAATNSADNDPVSGTGGRSANAHRQARSTIVDAFTQLYGRPPTTTEAQYAQAVGFQETGYGHWNGDMAGSNNWGAVQCPASQTGTPNCISHTDHYADGTEYTVSFRRYDTPTDGAKDMIKHLFTNGGILNSGAASDTGSVYQASYTERRNKYYEGFCPKATKQYGAQAIRKSFKTPDLNDATQACAAEAIAGRAQRAKTDIDNIAAACGDPYSLKLGSYDQANAWWQSRTSTGAPSPPAGGPVLPDAASSNWPANGAPNAAAASQQQAALAGSPLLSSSTGQSVTSAQQSTILAIQAALDAMAKTPPLALLVNPSSFSVKGDKIVTDGTWGRNGPIIEYWGDQQDKISGSGSVNGFFAMDTTDANGPGLTRWARNFSAAWQNFQGLFQLYRSNGALFLPDDTTQQQTQSLSMLGSIYIFYDNTIYIGSFDSFNITESDTKPHTTEYSFEFTVRAAFLLDRTDDAFDYGIPEIKPSGSIPVQLPNNPVSDLITHQPIPQPAAPTATNAQSQNLQQQIASRVQAGR